jgi:hypothetical protein
MNNKQRKKLLTKIVALFLLILSREVVEMAANQKRGRKKNGLNLK